MKWTLIVVVFGTMPVETDLIFNSLDDCLKAEEAMRAEYVRAYKDWTAGQKKALAIKPPKRSCGTGSGWKIAERAFRIEGTLRRWSGDRHRPISFIS